MRRRQVEPAAMWTTRSFVICCRDRIRSIRSTVLCGLVSECRSGIFSFFLVKQGLCISKILVSELFNEPSYYYLITVQTSQVYHVGFGFICLFSELRRFHVHLLCTLWKTLVVVAWAFACKAISRNEKFLHCCKWKRSKPVFTVSVTPKLFFT